MSLSIVLSCLSLSLSLYHHSKISQGCGPDSFICVEKPPLTTTQKIRKAVRNSKPYRAYEKAMQRINTGVSSLSQLATCQATCVTGTCSVSEFCKSEHVTCMSGKYQCIGAVNTKPLKDAAQKAARTAEGWVDDARVIAGSMKQLAACKATCISGSCQIADFCNSEFVTCHDAKYTCKGAFDWDPIRKTLKSVADKAADAKASVKVATRNLMQLAQCKSSCLTGKCAVAEMCKGDHVTCHDGRYECQNPIDTEPLRKAAEKVARKVGDAKDMVAEKTNDVMQLAECKAKCITGTCEVADFCKGDHVVCHDSKYICKNAVDTSPIRDALNKVVDKVGQTVDAAKLKANYAMQFAKCKAKCLFGTCEVRKVCGGPHVHCISGRYECVKNSAKKQ
jgi:hypothetical protein